MTGAFRSDGAPLTLDEYRRAGGYEVLRRAVTTMTPGEVIKVVEDSGLLGRGGAGFGTGRKWSFTPPTSKYSKYVVCNIDEMEPGSFKDRILIEGNPHLLVEGMAIASYATGSTIAYGFIRGEYTYPEQLLAKAIQEAYDAGFLGERIFGTDFSLHMYTHLSGGRYLCGEASAMLSALEGRRALPRFRPPHMASAGLWARPTIVNNVETLCCVPSIVYNGADWWLRQGLGDEGGTKIYTVAGRVKRPGAWELPMGSIMREIIEEHAGGMRDGLGIKGVVPGGASSPIVHPKHLDVRMDFGSMKKIGASLGTATMVVIDDKRCIVELLINLVDFYTRESCGWCTPCWSGTHWMLGLLKRIEAREGTPDDVDMLEHLCASMTPDTCFCDHGPSATRSVMVALKDYRDEVDAHLRPRVAGEPLMEQLSPNGFSAYMESRKPPLGPVQMPARDHGQESGLVTTGTGSAGEASAGTAAQ